MSKQLICEFCGREFIAKRISKRFCSRSCQRKEWRMSNPEKDRESRLKEQKRMRRLRKENFVPIEKQCIVCNEKFVTNKTTPYQKYCSWNCRNKNFRENNRDKILAYKKNYRNKHPERVREQQARAHDRKNFGGLRRKAMKRDKFKCVKCGREYPNFRLAVHHKDDNKQNNKMDNLMTVCCNCHAKIHSSSNRLE